MLDIYRHALIPLLLISTLVGCSSTNKAYYNSFQILFNSNTLDSPALDEIRANPSDLLQINIEGEPKAILVLAFIENDQYKWASADGVILQTYDNLIVRTAGLKDDLWHTSDLGKKPKLTPNLVDSTWLHSIDIDSKAYGVPVINHFKRLPEESKEYFGQKVSVIPIEQRVCMSCSANNPSTVQRYDWVNYYWLHAQSGDILATKQRRFFTDEVYEMTFLSRIARAIKE